MSKSLLETCDMAKLLFYRYVAKLFLRPPGKEWRGAIVLVLTIFKCVSTLSISSFINFNVNINFSTWNNGCVCF